MGRVCRGPVTPASVFALWTLPMSEEGYQDKAPEGSQEGRVHHMAVGVHVKIFSPSRGQDRHHPVLPSPWKVIVRQYTHLPFQ